MSTTHIHSRRQFLRRGTQAALALSSAAVLPRWLIGSESPAPLTPASEPSLPIIDTHQHLWDLGKLRLPWLKPGDPLTRNFLMKDYLEATKGLGITRAVYMEVDVEPADQLAEAEYILDICRRGDSPTVAAVIGGRPGEESFKSYITRFKGSPYIKGIRRIPQNDEKRQSLYRDKKFIKDIRFLGELGMRFDLCPRPGDLLDAVHLVDDCPDTQFILDHCGNADPKWYLPAGKEESAEGIAKRKMAAEQWQRDVAALAKRKNVVCKISGIIARAPKDSWTPDTLAPIIYYCLEAFGPNRVMFASDWPVCLLVATLRQWVEALQQVVRNRSLEDRKKLFCDNAIRVYGLTGSPVLQHGQQAPDR